VLALLALLAVPGREIIDLNGGWEFARVPDRPSIWNAADSVPRSKWRVISQTSEETSGENAGAKNAIDGDPKTFWHTEWSRRQAPYPHSIVIDMGVLTEAVGLRLLPRQVGPPNGRPKHYRLMFDSVLVSEGTVPNSGGLFEAHFAKVRGRRFQLDILDGYRPEPFLALAEIGLIRPNRLGSDWKSQYNIANAQIGGSDPSPADMGRMRSLELPLLKKWESATLPHAAWIRPLNTPKIWQGVTYYRRHVPPAAPGRRAILSFQGMQSVDVWLNGRHIAERRGGYLPVRANVALGGDLLVRIDNSDNPLIPPGKPQAELDFMYGNGIVSDAVLERTDSLHLSDTLEGNGGIRISPPTLSDGMATVSIQSIVRNDGSHLRSIELHLEAFDAHGRRVAQASAPESIGAGASQEINQLLRIKSPKLWSCDSPYLYRLRTTVQERHSVVDAIDTNFGLHTIEVSRSRGFLLNGKPLRLSGTNRHQDYPWVGPALSDAAQVRDAVLIKRSGHNIVRLSHYDQSPAFMDACDRLGILTIPCIPGWQFINQAPRFEQRVERDIRETIRRDQNHPCVAWWEASLNETYPPVDLARKWARAARDEGAQLLAGDMGSGVPWDIVYNTWKEDLSRPSDPVKPGYIREYGDYEFGGATSTARVRIGAGMPKLLEETWNHVWSLNKFRPQYPSTMGAGTWEMFDHNVPWDFAVSASGLADLMRREKPSFWFFASQESTTPYAKIAADWQPGLARRTVVVFTNASSASLFVNGRLVKREIAVRGPKTTYDLKNAFRGTDTANLAHPPIVFRDVEFAPGTLKVVASNGAMNAVRTAGKPVRLKVYVDDLGVPPTPNDLVFVRAAVVDAKGVVCPHESRDIRFKGAEFAGENHARAEMGIASVLVRTTKHAGPIRVRAIAGGLTGSSL